MTSLSTPSRARSALCVALTAMCLAGCAHAASTPVEPRTLPAAPDEALDVLAAWIALVGVDTRAELRELKAPGFRFREIDGRVEEHVDRTRRLRVCGDPEIWVGNGGYEVEMWVHALGTDGLVRVGHRRLSMRAVDGALKVASDTFEVKGRHEASVPWPDGVPCRPSGPGCVVILEDGAARRLPWLSELSWPPRTQFSTRREESSPR